MKYILKKYYLLYYCNIMKKNDKKEELIFRLEDLLRNGGVNKVFYIDPNPRQAIPPNGNFSGNDRLAIPFEGCHRMEIPGRDGIRQLLPMRHNATFMPKGSWNRPDWVLPVKVVTFGLTSEYISYSFVDFCGKGLQERSVARGKVQWSGYGGQVLPGMMGKMFADSPDAICGVILTEALAVCCLEALKSGDAVFTGKASYTYDAIRAYLDECYSADLSREEVARVFNISPNYLSNLFKARFGAGFAAYLNQLRIKRACYLLRNFNQTLDEVAFNCGYHETGYFCRIFKKNMGMTPGKFRLSAGRQAKRNS